MDFSVKIQIANNISNYEWNKLLSTQKNCWKFYTVGGHMHFSRHYHHLLVSERLYVLSRYFMTLYSQIMRSHVSHNIAKVGKRRDCPLLIPYLRCGVHRPPCPGSPPWWSTPCTPGRYRTYHNSKYLNSLFTRPCLTNGSQRLQCFVLLKFLWQICTTFSRGLHKICTVQ